jgi:hypothetical protein
MLKHMVCAVTIVPQRAEFKRFIKESKITDINNLCDLRPKVE